MIMVVFGLGTKISIKERLTKVWTTQSQGDHGTGKTGNLVLTFSRQGKHREFCSDTGENLLTQGKYLDCDY